MKVLDFNNRFILATLQDKAILLKSPSLELISSYKGSYTIGSLQYQTGIAALGLQNLVIFYDFKYERKRQQLDTVLRIISIKIIKNLLFCTSANRILIYDISTKNNICNISTSDGSLVTYNSSYYNLKLMYPISTNIYHQQQIWGNKTKKIQCSPCSIIKYDRTGEILCLAQDNIIALYQNQQIIRGCSFEDKITDIVPSFSISHKFYIRTQKSQQNKSQNKVLYVEVSVSKKFYLKLAEQQILGSEKQILKLIGAQSQLLFEYEGTLYVGKNNKVYKTQIDVEPNVKGLNKQEWQKLEEQKIIVNSQSIEIQEQQVPRTERVQNEFEGGQEQKKMEDSINKNELNIMLKNLESQLVNIQEEGKEK